MAELSRFQSLNSHSRETAGDPSISLRLQQPKIVIESVVLLINSRLTKIKKFSTRFLTFLRLFVYVADRRR